MMEMDVRPRCILCIEDSPESQMILNAALKDYSVVFAENLRSAKDHLQRRDFDLVILDSTLPDGNGLQLFDDKILQEDDVPVIMVTGKSDLATKEKAFHCGAVDFLTKPFDPNELKIRVDARIRKNEKIKNGRDKLIFGDLTCNLAQQKIYLAIKDNREALPLTTIEFKIVMMLMQTPNRVFTRSEIVDRVWGKNFQVTDRTIDSHIAHVRKKIRKSKVRIKTVVSIGYRLVADPSLFPAPEK